MKPLSYTKAKEFLKKVRTDRYSEEYKLYSLYIKEGMIPYDNFWYTNKFTYDLWLKRKDNTDIDMSKYSYQNVFDAFSNILSRIDYASASASYSNYTPDAMGN